MGWYVPENEIKALVELQYRLETAEDKQTIETAIEVINKQKEQIYRVAYVNKILREKINEESEVEGE